jgi:carbon-monoxide dehydrogenase small subunit
MTETVTLTVNGSRETASIPPRLPLSDLLRDELGLTGTKRGCDTARCGACTVLLIGDPVKSCNLLALQAAGSEVTTVEGLGDDGELTALQRAFWEELSFQCGFCTSGMLVTAHALLVDDPDPSEEQIRDHLAGNLCRCTGYTNVVAEIETADRRMEDED